MTQDLEIPDLIAYALYEVDERARGFTLPLQLFLASLALFESPGSLTATDLFAAVAGLLPSPDINTADFDATIAQGVSRGLIAQDEHGVLSLSNERRSELDGAANKLESHREQFHARIRTSVENETGDALADEEAQFLAERLEHHLLRFFHDHSVSLAAAFGPNGRGFDATMPGLQAPKLERLVNALVNSTNKLRRSQFLIGLREGLLHLDAPSKAHMATLYQKTVAFALLRQDPSIQRVKRELAKRRVVYLDTNVLMAWMFEAQPSHELAREVIALARSVQCEVRVSRFTLEELELQLHESDTKYRQIKHREGVLAFIDDDVLRTYQRRKDNTPALAWQAFLAEYLPPKPWLIDHDVTCDQFEDWANAIQDDRAERVRLALQGAKKGSTHPKLIDFDVHNLLYVHLRRQAWRADEMGSRVWFVTLDHGLGRAETTLVKQRVYAVPASHDAEAWCEFLGPYAVPDSPELDDYVTHLVHSQLGLLGEDPEFVSTNFLITLEESEFDVQELLKAGPDRARQVLVALQENREVKRLIEADEQDKLSPEWSSRLAAAVHDALRDIDVDPALTSQITDARRQRDEARQAERAAKRERDTALRQWAELRTDREEIDQRLKELEAAQTRARRTLLQRLLRRPKDG